jgi:hypothetical protein
MKYGKFLLAVGVLFGSVTSTSYAALTSGISGGKSVVYSSVSDVTWTGDANLLGSLINSQGYNTIVNAIIAASPIISDSANFYDSPPYSGNHNVTTADFSTGGLVNWFGAKAFVTYLNSIDYADSNQWTLPSVGINPQFGYNKTGSQLGQLFYTELQGQAYASGPNTDYFTNEIWSYWMATESSSANERAWFLDSDGYQYHDLKNHPYYSAWAVSPGNLLTTVPIPGAIWSFGSGLLGLLGLKRRHA